MITVCPKCTLTLAVTAADLRTGQGHVRCGHCGSVFNALLALTDGSPDELPPSTTPPMPEPMPAPAPAPTATPEVELEEPLIAQHAPQSEEAPQPPKTLPPALILETEPVDDHSLLNEPEPEVRARPRRRVLWSTLAALLTLLLGVQLLHHWRNDLAVRDDWIGRPVVRLYQRLGLSLTPNWDVQAYDIKQLGAATDSGMGDLIHVSISLTNHAKRAQPWPLVRLNLYNRFGKRIATRDLQPQDYLPAEKIGGMMTVAQQINSEVAVINPGSDASSFDLDVCVPAPQGLHCAADSPLKSARP